MNILIAEDDEFNRRILETQMKIHGFSTASVTNGKEAIEVLDKKKFDLILMDIRMPVMDGIEATRHIREKMPEDIRNIPIIAVTAYAMAEHERELISEGMNGFLAKPFTSESLIRKINEVMDNKMREDRANQKPPANQHPIHDISSVLQMAHGNYAFIEAAIQSFIRQSGESLAAILKAYDEDRPEALRLIHKIKPAFLYVGLQNIYDSLIDIEKEVSENKNIVQNRKRIADIYDLMPQIHRQLEKDLHRLRKEMK